MDKRLADYWDRWWQRHHDRRQREEHLELVSIKTRRVKTAARCLFHLHAGLRSGLVDNCFSGPLTYSVIQSWIPVESQRFVSREALDHINGDGNEKALRNEHHPPVSLIRDYIRETKTLSVNTLVAILGGVQVTIVTKNEDERLRKATYKSERPLDAYENTLVGIKRLSYAHYKKAIAARRVRDTVAKAKQANLLRKKAARSRK